MTACNLVFFRSFTSEITHGSHILVVSLFPHSIHHEIIILVLLTTRLRNDHISTLLRLSLDTGVFELRETLLKNVVSEYGDLVPWRWDMPRMGAYILK